ncbi:MAG: antitoxin [Trebonia sp.]
MPDFGELINKAKDLAGKHQDQVHKGVEKAEELAEKKLGDGSGDKVEKAGDAVEGFLGVHHEPE